MSVRTLDGVLHVEGNGLVEDAEPILAALLDDPGITIDLRGSGRLHTAIVQLLLALRPRIVGAPADSFYARHIAPLLNADQGSA